MQSYIGVLARSKVEIWRESWRSVPMHTKNKIWKLVQDGFLVPENFKKACLSSAAQKWREFGSRLTSKYIIPLKNHPEQLKYPPEDYNWIEQAQWAGTCLFMIVLRKYFRKKELRRSG